MIHTKGPWAASEHGAYGDYNGNSIVILGDDLRIAVVLGYDNEETQANANLIAAAPLLLEALEACVEQLEHDSRDCYSTGPYTGDHIADLVRCPGCAAISKARAAIAKSKGGV